MKETIRSFVLDLGVDDVGFASADDYRSPNSSPLESLFPGVKSIIVLAFRELSACESPSPQMAMNARLDLHGILPFHLLPRGSIRGRPMRQPHHDGFRLLSHGLPALPGSVALPRSRFATRRSQPAWAHLDFTTWLFIRASEPGSSLLRSSLNLS